jgi:hypothetical protein
LADSPCALADKFHSLAEKPLAEAEIRLTLAIKSKAADKFLTLTDIILYFGLLTVFKPT